MVERQMVKKVSNAFFDHMPHYFEKRKGVKRQMVKKYDVFDTFSLFKNKYGQKANNGRKPRRVKV